MHQWMWIADYNWIGGCSHSRRVQVEGELDYQCEQSYRASCVSK